MWMLPKVAKVLQRALDRPFKQLFVKWHNTYQFYSFIFELGISRKSYMIDKYNAVLTEMCVYVCVCACARV